MDWRVLFNQEELEEAEEDVRRNSVRNLLTEENRIRATVAGEPDFQVDIWKNGESVLSMTCSCPKAKAGGSCRHMAAAMLAWEKNTGEGKTDAQLQEAVKTQPEENANLQLTCDIDDVLNYAMIHNGAHIVRDICLQNAGDKDLEGLTVRISSDNGLIEEFHTGIDRIKPDESVHLKNLYVPVNGGYLASLTERSSCRVTVAVCAGEVQLAGETVTITALAYDQWPGLQYTPELLAAFVMPNHPVVTSLLQLAANYLEKWTGNPSLAGYQDHDPNRVNHMAAAAYGAIQQKNITYAQPPSSFEACGQRIRLADAVLDQHLGTCMDMTLLYVACLEAMGLNPVMVLMKGHIFAGVWLVEDSFGDMIMDDPSQLEKRMSRGIRELTVVECTAMCAGKSRSFDEAVSLAEANVSHYGNFAFVIDVKRARSMGIRPLPVRVKTDEGFFVPHEERTEGKITGASKKNVEIFDLPDQAQKTPVTRLTQWERKLLDLSLRNMLINMRMTRNVVPLLSPDVSILEDALSNGEEFQVLPRPAEMKVSGDDGVPVEALGQLGPFADFIALESRHKRLHSLYSEKELNSCLTKVFRSAKTSLEENGASTLYLALGLLRWVENEGEAVRYAPVVLVPIEIIRKSAARGYAMRMRDEDAQLNITLLEFLKQNYELQIPGLNPPPADEYGLDLPKIFAIIRRAVINLPMWDVVEAGFIGNFSFSQFVMWNDIHTSSAFLEKNKIVRSLLLGAVDWDCTIPEEIRTDEAYLPVTADSSQLRAINMAAAGVSFVLHGPPGTGKSQTITAMIANALTKGKTVLFVAEKKAALEVVQKRLAALGIEDFCLELHSNKSTKKAVLDQLKRGLELDSRGMETDYEEKILDIRRMRTELDAYVKALHTERPFGKSLRQLIDLYETIPEQDTYVWFDHDYAASLTEQDLDHQMHSLERLVAAGKGVGHPHGHCLAAVRKTEYSQRLKFDLNTVICTYTDALNHLRQDVLAFADMMGLEHPVTEAEWLKICTVARSMIAVDSIPPFLRNCANVERAFAVPQTYLERLEAFAARKESLGSAWNENFLRMDMDVFRDKFDQAHRKFFGKGKALAALTAELQAYAAFPVETERIPAYLTDVVFYQQEERELSEAENALPFEWKEILAGCPTRKELQAYQEGIQRHMQLTEAFSWRIRQLETDKTLERCIRTAGSILEGWEAVKKEEAETTALLDLSFSSKDVSWLDSRLSLCACILENASSIKDWIVYRQYAAECRQRGLGPVCEAYEDGLEHDAVMNVYLRSVYRAIILSVIEGEPVLNGFTGIGFNEKIAQFKKLDQEFMDLTREEMLCRLTRQLPTSFDSVETSRELNTLRRAISSNGRGVSVRSLFEQIPHILPLLCPCMLMSPISAAQYLQAENDLFDLVIFDEASQLPTCKAVGVLARGKNAVIVGDPNQMPPTSFFAGNTVDEDNLDIEDLDSILDDCLALGMPSAHLQWHYRSRHESLIAFSNQEFYENSMLTFPSVNDRERRVSLVRTEGFFARGKGRVNEGEAKAIVEEIKKRYRDPERKLQTVGVVTFNISQQALIEDLLQEEYQKDGDFDRWANLGEEPLFVKNLENVQGDERDVILFSIAFGPDEEGKLSLNFGPLNKNGGWKRLNVAVSRARSEMMVFTTMTADMIDLRRTKARGVEALKDFLEFAQKGRLPGEYVETRVQKDQGILEHICRAIAEGGYRYQKAVGHSRFRIDIAVINPYNEEEYLMGIMLDGEAYRQSQNTKDREVSQIDVLKNLGWDLHRIWTMDWWDNRNRELEKLMQLLEMKKEDARLRFLKAQREDAGDNLRPAQKCGEEEERTEASVRQEREIINQDNETGTEKETDIQKDAADRKTDKPADQEPAWARENIPIGSSAEAETIPDGEKLFASEISSPTAEIPSDPPVYQIEEYRSAQIAITDISTSDYAKKENLKRIAEKMQQILDAEAPIACDRLMKKTMRAFNISRSSPQTLEATDRALKKISAKTNKQAGVKFYWRKDQDPDRYWTYRLDVDPADKRSVEEICQQELKNVVCLTLMEKGNLDKESLIRETIRKMGYARSGAALAAAVERGIRHGRRTGEILQDEEKNYTLSR